MPGAIRAPAPEIRRAMIARRTRFPHTNQAEPVEWGGNRAGLMALFGLETSRPFRDAAERVTRGRVSGDGDPFVRLQNSRALSNPLVPRPHAPVLSAAESVPGNSRYFPQHPLREHRRRAAFAGVAGNAEVKPSTNYPGAVG